MEYFSRSTRRIQGTGGSPPLAALGAHRRKIFGILWQITRRIQGTGRSPPLVKSPSRTRTITRRVPNYTWYFGTQEKSSTTHLRSSSTEEDFHYPRQKCDQLMDPSETWRYAPSRRGTPNLAPLAYSRPMESRSGRCIFFELVTPVMPATGDFGRVTKYSDTWPVNIRC